ncbi:uncharacterized protein PB18E9.04c-like [Diaphorina citri]|uniref:Uncharacterized protein PB18E9.04c-like n=1 Tax=Diaphorina citri TaxID=121845 RepID=A0A3Q0IYW6_DIACI|nr:uncharacterized protein PB18E9.04c-like [Diaphorina citri]
MVLWFDVPAVFLVFQVTIFLIDGSPLHRSRLKSSYGRSKFGKLPFHAVVQASSPGYEPESLSCEAFIVDHRHVLTLASCVQRISSGPSPLEVQVDQQTEPIVQIVYHPSNSTDLALLRVAHEIEFKPNVQPFVPDAFEKSINYHACMDVNTQANAMALLLCANQHKSLMSNQIRHGTTRTSTSSIPTTESSEETTETDETLETTKSTGHRSSRSVETTEETLDTQEVTETTSESTPTTEETLETEESTTVTTESDDTPETPETTEAPKRTTTNKPITPTHKPSTTSKTTTVTTESDDTPETPETTEAPRKQLPTNQSLQLTNHLPRQKQLQ